MMGTMVSGVVTDERVGEREGRQVAKIVLYHDELLK
jgi:hypothetical protein